MKNIVTTLLLALFVSCLGTVNNEHFSSQKTSQQGDVGTQENLQGKGTIQDEYWPFENTVQQSDPYVSEVLHKLEGRD